MEDPVTRLAVCLAVAIGLSGCAPLDAQNNFMVPYAEGSHYGYQDAAIAESQVEVQFTGPRRLTSSYSSNTQRADIALAQEEARDHALWRAAQLSLAKGFQKLSVDSVESEAEVYFSPRRSASLFFPRNIHHFSRDDPAYRLVRYHHSPPRAYVVAQTLLRATFGNDGKIDAQETIDRLSAKYPGT